MLDNHKLIIDTQCNLYEILLPWTDGEFWDLSHHDIVPGACYIIDRVQFSQHVDRIRQVVESGLARVILSNPNEGSDTIRWQCRRLGIDDLARSGKILILSGGDLDSEYKFIQYDHFMTKIHHYTSNLVALKRSTELYSKLDKPYKFLFLNGRARPHRKFLLEKFKQCGLLEQALWTNLDPGPAGSRVLKLVDGNENLMTRSLAVQYLPPDYEFKEYQHNINSVDSMIFDDIKSNLFNRTWGDVFIKPEPYIDTYFSLVTETVFDYPYSFRTEKIWKPVAIGHPWIVASNCGFYRDMQNLGFQTFGHLIDESFDQIANDQARMERIVQVVTDLCQQDLAQFLTAAEEVCKYNQQHLIETRQQVIQSFPNRFSQFLSQHE